MDYLTTESAVRDTIGTPPPSINIKKLDVFEEHSKRYLEMSRLVAIAADCFSQGISFIARESCKLRFLGDKSFSLEIDDFPEFADKVENEPCGLYVLVAGFEESLRINGKLTATSGKTGSLIFKIGLEELYFHCGKSIKRSDFWSPGDCSKIKETPARAVEFSSTRIKNFLDSAPFLLIASKNSEGDVDLSPRGDTRGFIKVIDKQTVLIPERPGNKIADSLVNITTNSSVSVTVLSPGSNNTLTLSGNARLLTSPALLESSKVQNKLPKLGIELTVESCHFGVNPALAEMDLWNEGNFEDRTQLPSLGRILSDQLQATGKVPGKKSAIGRALGRIAGSVGNVAVELDYKKNLY